MYGDVFDELWSRTKSIFMENAEPYVSTGVHPMIFETTLNVMQSSGLSDKRIANTLKIMMRMFPFVEFVADKYSFKDTIKCCWAYSAVSLYDPALFSRLVRALNANLSQIERDPAAFSTYLLDQFMPTDLFVPLLKALNYAYMQERLLKCMDPKDASPEVVTPLTASAKEYLLKHLISPENLRKQTTETLLESCGTLDYPQIFSMGEHKLCAERLVNELVRRDVLESKNCPQFVIATLARVYHLLPRERALHLLSSANLELGLRVGAILTKDKKSCTFENSFELAQAAVKLCNIAQELHADLPSFHEVAINSLSLLWIVLNNSGNTQSAAKHQDAELLRVAENKVRTLDATVLTARALALLLPSRSILSKYQWEELEKFVEAGAKGAAEALSREAVGCMSGLSNLRVAKSKRNVLSVSYAPFGDTYKSPLNDPEEAKRERFFLGKDNVDLTQQDYDTIVDNSKKIKSISGYDVNMIMIGKDAVNTSGWSMYDLADVLQGLFDLNEAVLKLKLISGPDVIFKTKETLDKMLAFEEGRQMMRIFAFASSGHMRMLHKGLMRLTGDLASPQIKEFRRDTVDLLAHLIDQGVFPVECCKGSLDILELYSTSAKLF